MDTPSISKPRISKRSDSYFERAQCETASIWRDHRRYCKACQQIVDSSETKHVDGLRTRFTRDSCTRYKRVDR